MQQARATSAVVLTRDAAQPATLTPWLVTVEILSTIYSNAGKTPSAIRADIFKSEDRVNSRGERIAGNGLAAHGAIVRRGRRVLIDVHRYGNWLAGRAPVQS